MMLQKVPLFSEQMIQKLWDNNNESHHADIDDISCSCEYEMEMEKDDFE